MGVSGIISDLESEVKTQGGGGDTAFVPISKQDGLTCNSQKETMSVCLGTFSFTPS